MDQEFQCFYTDYVVVETDEGTEYVPLDEYDGEVDQSDPDVFRRGYLWRASAPGYLDCTPWYPANTRFEAEQEYFDIFDACPMCGTRVDEEATRCPNCLWAFGPYPIRDVFSGEVVDSYEGEPTEELIELAREHRQNQTILHHPKGLQCGRFIVWQNDEPLTERVQGCY